MSKKLTNEEKAGVAKRKAHHKEKTDKLDGNIFEHIMKISEMESDKMSYFYWVSPLWRAIQDHIAHAKDCVLIDRDGTIVCHRGGAFAAISLLETHVYRGDYVDGKLVEPTIFGICLEVEYYSDETNNVYRKTYNIIAPQDLELNFTKKKFKAWIAELRGARDKGRKKNDLKELRRLKKLYPRAR